MFVIAMCGPVYAITISGIASWYKHGTITASGQAFNPNGLTAAHRTLPFGTRVKVTHNGKSIIVTINDRGPYVAGRIIDLSEGAAKALGCLYVGKCPITLDILN